MLEVDSKDGDYLNYLRLVVNYSPSGSIHLAKLCLHISRVGYTLCLFYFCIREHLNH